MSDARGIVRASIYLVTDTADISLVRLLPVRTFGYEMLSTDVIDVSKP